MRPVLAAAVLAGAAVLGVLPLAPAAAAATPTCTQSCYLDARTGAHPDFDRLVFDLAGPTLPTAQGAVSATGEYVAGSGDAKFVQIPGSSYLMLHSSFSHTTYDDGTKSYTTPTVQPVSLPSIKGVQLIGDSEGYTDFGISLGSYSRYQISNLTSPNRLIVDVYH
ncbi:hypothetical protein ABT095_06870 [Kitasatospora sp. NPDC002227]|uniref:AMIN-like domain-containing (lipo)protein n=1 Tax=Kitasatospora sp. NPDC002227 TaxID=3154773 RepID=UPI0033175E49